MLENITAITEAEGVADILFNHEDGGALIGDLANRLEDVLDEDGRQSKRRFVKHQEMRLGHQAAADGDHRALQRARFWRTAGRDCIRPAWA